MTVTLLADKGYDAAARVIEPLQRAGKTAVIPSKANRKVPLSTWSLPSSGLFDDTP